MRIFYQATLAIFSSLFLLSPQVQAAPTLKYIKDFNTNPYLEIGEGAILGDSIYFVYRNPNSGRELYKMVLATGAVSLVKQIVPGASDPTFDPLSEGSSYATEVRLAGSKVVFFADDGVNGVELWASDGTAAGTTLIKDIEPGSEGISPYSFVSGGAHAYFVTSTTAEGSEIWSTDGTTAGTHVFDIYAGADSSYPSNLTVSENTSAKFVFFYADNGSTGSEPYYINGTSDSLTFIKDVNSGSLGSFPDQFYLLTSKVLFTAYESSTGYEPYISDGTSGGTSLLKDVVAGANYGSPSCYLGTSPAAFKFLAYNATGTGFDVWQSNGTSGGTTLVTSLPDGAIVSKETGEANCKLLGSSLYFDYITDALGREPYISDGTVLGTKNIVDIASGPNDGARDILGTLTISSVPYTIFTAQTAGAGLELWRSDGTAAGTVRIKDILSGAASSSPRFLASTTTSIYFTAFLKQGSKLRAAVFVTDGTTSGTRRIGYIPTNDISDSLILNEGKVIGDKAFLSIYSPKYGVELWKTDGSASGTTFIKDINAGVFDSYPSNFLKFKNLLVFSAVHRTLGRELFKSTGSSSGTKLVKDIRTGVLGSNARPLGVIGNKLILAASTAEEGSELYTSNGTEAGTNLLVDLNPGTSSGVSTNTPLVLGSNLFFRGNNGSTGNELYKTNGTSAGTVLVKDIRAGPTGSSPDRLTKFKNKFLFSASEGTTGTELWISDGTEAGTTRVKDIRSGSSSSSPTLFTKLGSRMIFRASDGVVGTELWITDGTESGTQLVKDIEPGANSSNPSDLVSLGSKVVFKAFDSTHGTEPWVSNGTVAGTFLLKDLEPGARGSSPSNFVVSGKFAYFSRYNSSGVSEVWRTNGTSSGTKKLVTLKPAIADTLNYVDQLVVLKKQLLIFTNQGPKGREFFKIVIP